MNNTYEGKPCNHCGNTTRYIVEKRCVYCKAKRNAIFVKNKTAAGLAPRPDAYQVDYGLFENKDRYFEGKPCRTCGSPFRYIKGGRCVICHSNRARRKRAEKKEANE